MYSTGWRSRQNNSGVFLSDVFHVTTLMRSHVHSEQMEKQRMYQPGKYQSSTNEQPCLYMCLVFISFICVHVQIWVQSSKRQHYNQSTHAVQFLPRIHNISQIISKKWNSYLIIHPLNINIKLKHEGTWQTNDKQILFSVFCSSVPHYMDFPDRREAKLTTKNNFKSAIWWLESNNLYGKYNTSPTVVQYILLLYSIENY